MRGPKPREIVQRLEAPAPDRRPVVKQIEQSASGSELIAALRGARTAVTRQILCDILGRRHQRSAVPALINALQDHSPKVRASAADALAKIGSVRAGPLLLQHFTDAGEDVEVRQMLAAALGAVGYRAAVPSLVQALGDSDGTLRGCAAWSLGALRVKEARGPLERALAQEKDAYAAERLREALRQIAAPPKKKRATTSPPRKTGRASRAERGRGHKQ